MNKRFLSVVLFALIISAAASLLLYRLVATRLTANARPPSTQIVVANRNLEVGALIREPDVKIAEWTGHTPRGAVLRREDVLGRGVVATIYEGEPVLDSRLAAHGAGAGMAAIIPPGMRAVGVRVNEVVGLAGFVVPGMRVDVLVSGNPPGNSQAQGTLTRTVLQNIEVLSAGQNIQKDAEGKPVSVQVVNLLVTPEQAEVLSLASNETRIQLVLRNPLDTQEAKTPGTAVGKLFNMNQPATLATVRPKPAPKPKPVVVVEAPPPPPPKPAPIAVEVIIGSKRAESKFEQTDQSADRTRVP